MADATKPPLTLAEIVGFKPPASLHDWTLVQDDKGGYSFRAKINGISYIATPEKWEGRTLEGNAMGQTNFGLNLESLHGQVPGTFTTNNPNFRPPGAETATTAACPTPDPMPLFQGLDLQTLLLPGVLIVGIIVLIVTRHKKG